MGSGGQTTGPDTYPSYLIMGGVLSSIPLCSRAKIEATEANGGPEAPEERGQTEVTPATVMSQPQSTVIQQQAENFETCIDNENVYDKFDEEVGDSNLANEEGDEATMKTEDASDESNNDADQVIEEDDGNEEVSLDDEPVTEPEEAGETSPEDESYRKTSPELDTAAAITNILSEIVGDSDSRAVVGR